jgi:hypothetical protein
MRRAAASIATLAGSALMLAISVAPAFAAPQCSDQSDREIFDVTALKSRLMVLATGCGDNTQYNAFMTRFQPQLVQYDRDLEAYFRRHYGKAFQREYDAYITALANGESDVGITEGSDFCPHDALIFHEVMALQAPADLPAYAAGKDLVPPTLGSCVAAASPAPSHVPVRKAKR